jgi:hypothetical protein
MKYSLNVDALLDCLCCLDGVNIDNEIYINLKTAIGLIKGFPKDPVDPYEIKLPEVTTAG